MVNSYQLPHFYHKEEGTPHLCNVDNHFSVDTVRHPQTTDQNLHEVDKCWISKRSACAALTEAGNYKNQRKRNHDKYKAKPKQSCVLDESGYIHKRFSVIYALLYWRVGDCHTNGIILYCRILVCSAYLDYWTKLPTWISQQNSQYIGRNQKLGLTDYEVGFLTPQSRLRLPSDV
jgi:hypothetical protein